MQARMNKTVHFKKVLFALAFTLVACVLMAVPVRADIASGTAAGCPWRITDDGELIFGEEGVSHTIGNVGSSNYLGANKNNVKSISFAGTVKATGSMNGMFRDLKNLTTINPGLDASQATEMRETFSGCTSLSDISGLATWNPLNAEQADSMFNNCTSLTNLNGLDGWSWTNSRLYNINAMFQNCSKLSDISAISTWDLSQSSAITVYMNSIFNGCKALTDCSPLANWNVSKVRSFGSSFRGTGITNTDFMENWNTGNLTDMGSAFRDCSKLSDLTGLANLDVSKVTTLERIFNNCTSLTDLAGLEGWNTGNVIYMQYAFSNTRITGTSALSGWNTAKVLSMENVFSACSALNDLSGLTDWNVERVTNLTSAFQQCSNLTSLAGLENWNTRAASDFRSLFADCTRLSDISALSGWNTENATLFGNMFFQNSALTNIDALADWDVSKVRQMPLMFYNCSNLQDIGGLANWNTESLTTVEETFHKCSALTSLEPLLNWKTGKVTNTKLTFAYCSSLPDLHGLENWDMGKVTNMQNMFMMDQMLLVVDELKDWNVSSVTNMSGTLSYTSITSIDLSGWNTSAVTNANNIFYSDSRLEKVILGPDFSFAAAGMQLPAPNASKSTGRWIRDDGVFGPYTPAQLKAEYTPAMAGTWIWELNSSNAVVRFDANGGYTDAADIAQTAPFRPITFPTATRPGYELVGWSLDPDGTAPIYRADGSGQYTPAGGTYTTFYAVWGVPTTYQVKHYRQNASMTGYDLAATETLNGLTNDIVTPDTHSYDGFTSPQTQTVTLIENGATVVEYRYDRQKYTIHFDGNGENEGTMPDMVIPREVSKRLADNRFRKDNNVFTGWNTEADGSGTAYGDAQTVLNLLEDGQSITLYAQWLDISGSEVQASDGVYTVTLKAGETLTIPNLPDGTNYTVTEVNIPAGWRQDGTSGTDGSIVANQTVSASIRNVYSANGSISLVAYKNMPDTELNGGEFAFELSESGNVIETAVNGTVDKAEQVLTENDETIPNPYYGMSIVSFATINYTQAGIHTYKIRETAGDDDNINYDGHEETVTVEVTDMKNGNLRCKATYDADGPVFTNTKKPRVSPNAFGSLSVTKTVSNMDTTQDFTFSLSLTDAEGVALTDSFEGKIYADGSEKDMMELANGASFTLKSGETLRVGNIPAGTVYAVAETDIPAGYELVNTSGTDGTIAEDTESNAMFENIYNADGNAVLTARKEFSGGEIGENQFRFCLTDEGGTILQEAYAQTDGSITFAPIIYSQADAGKKYSYSIYEEKGDDAGVAYDGHTLEALVAVTDNGDGSLDTSVTYKGETTFRNTLLETEQVITARKNFLHGDLTVSSFRFELLDGSEVIATASSDENGQVSFPAITYHGEDIGEHTYTIREVTGADNIHWDTHTETVTITVSKPSDNELEATAEYDADGAVFTNNALLPKDLTVAKTVTGNMGDKSKEFAFSLTLTSPAGETLPNSLTYEKEGETGTALLEGGKYAFTLAHGESITFKDIHADTDYVVREEGVLFQGYNVTKENASGTIGDSDVDVSFINHKFISVPTSADIHTRGMAVLTLLALAMIGMFGFRRARNSG